MDFTLNNDSKAVAKTIKNQFKDTNLEDLEKMINRYKEADVWLKTPEINEEFFNTLTKLLKDNNLINKDVYYKDLVINLNA